MAISNASIRLRLIANVVVFESGCWLWQRHIDKKGYGKTGHAGKTVMAHRLSYEVFVGPIPPGYDVDHTCHDPKTCNLTLRCPHRRCINPEHLEATTRAENIRRSGSGVINQHQSKKTHCPKGHPYTEPNIFWVQGHRQCRECKRLAKAAQRALR